MGGWGRDGDELSMGSYLVPSCPILLPPATLGVGACCHFQMAGNPLVHVRGKAGKYGVLSEEAGNPGSGFSLLSVPYSPAGFSL